MEKEIQAYRKLTNVGNTEAVRVLGEPNQTLVSGNTVGSPQPVINKVSTTPIPGGKSTVINSLPSTMESNEAPTSELVHNIINLAGTSTEGVSAIGKFTVTTPASPSAAPNLVGIVPNSMNNMYFPVTSASHISNTNKFIDSGQHPISVFQIDPNPTVTSSAQYSKTQPQPSFQTTLAQNRATSPLNTAQGVPKPPPTTSIPTLQHKSTSKLSDVDGNIIASNKDNFLRPAIPSQPIMHGMNLNSNVMEPGFSSGQIVVSDE